jgi:hypothetical protein
MNKHLNDNCVDLIVENDDAKFVKVSKKFLKDLEVQFESFKTNWNDENEKLEKYLNKKNFVFKPEKLAKKSPLTLLNAPWGTGKTYFIENFVKLFIDEEIKSEVFKKIIIIDAWKFSNSRDVPFEFAAELARILINMQTKVKDQKIWKLLFKKMLVWMTPTNWNWKFEMNFFGFGVSTESKKSEKEQTEKEVKKYWKLIEENAEPTIIFVDNIERLGSFTWDLLKSIIKLQEFDNYLIVLPMNINKLSNNEKNIKNSEYPIEKYIDFNYYNFIQGYDSFFKTYIPDDKDWVDKLNLIFNSEVNGKKLSIRELESLFRRYKFFDCEEKYDQLELIYNSIWPAEEVINGIIQQDIKLYFEYHKSISDVVKKVIEKLFIIDENDNKYVNFADEKFQNKLYSFEQKDNFGYCKNNDYIEIFKNINYELARTFQYYEGEIKRYSNDTNEESRNYLSPRINEEYDRRLKNLAMSDQASNLFSPLGDSKKWFSPRQVYTIESKSIRESELTKFNVKLNRMTKNINEFIKDIEKIKSEYQLGQDQIERIDKFIENELKFPKTLNNGDFEGYKKLDIRKFWKV